jgi:hypothetical protein
MKLDEERRGTEEKGGQTWTAGDAPRAVYFLFALSGNWRAQEVERQQGKRKHIEQQRLSNNG